jgi:hypothetical protein
MNKGVLLFVLTMVGPGCIIRHEDGEGVYDDAPTASEARVCGSNNECKAGCYCDPGARRCRTSATCLGDDDCQPGFRCDSRWTCVPRDDHPVADGGAARTDGGTGSGTSSVSHDGGGGTTTDALAACDAMTTGSTTCAPRCRFDQQCGPGARCRDGGCQRPCTSGTSCGTGAVCRDGFCQPDTQAGGQCIYTNQCPTSGACINGYCHAGCARDTDCPNHADVCDRGVCRPDQRPLPPCTGNAQCSTGQSCVDGLCRPSCGCDADCAATSWGATSVCLRGFCAAPEEK